MKFIKKYIFYIFCVVFVVIYFCFFSTAEVSGSSMSPTFEHGDFLLLRKTQDVKRNDIIAIYSDVLDKLIFKRVIGVSEDFVKISGSDVYVNNTKLEEDYIKESFDSNLGCVVDEGNIFVLGDNRNNSTDSRDLGCLPVEDVYGVYLFNITKSFGVTHSDLSVVLFLVWILIFSYFIILDLCKRRRKSEM